MESENDNHYSYDNGKEDHEISTNGFNNYNIYKQDMESKFDQTDNFFAQESEKTVIKGDIMDLKPVSDNFEDIQNFNNLENHQNGINRQEIFLKYISCMISLMPFHFLFMHNQVGQKLL